MQKVAFVDRDGTFLSEPDEGCDCRKPKIGGVKKFLEKNPDTDLKSSLMFGDRDTERGFAKNLGVRFVRIKTNDRFILPKEVYKKGRYLSGALIWNVGRRIAIRASVDDLDWYARVPVEVPAAPQDHTYGN